MLNYLMSSKMEPAFGINVSWIIIKIKIQNSKTDFLLSYNIEISNSSLELISHSYYHQKFPTISFSRPSGLNNVEPILRKDLTIFHWYKHHFRSAF
jgi:hypothetical protein